MNRKNGKIIHQHIPPLIPLPIVVLPKYNGKSRDQGKSEPVRVNMGFVVRRWKMSGRKPYLRTGTRSYPNTHYAPQIIVPCNWEKLNETHHFIRHYRIRLISYPPVGYAQAISCRSASVRLAFIARAKILIISSALYPRRWAPIILPDFPSVRIV